MIADAKYNPSAEQRLFQGLDRASGKIKPSRWVDHLFRPFWSTLSPEVRDWQSSAKYAIDRQQVLRARAILYFVVAMFAILLLWSALASVDEVTRGEGKVIPSRQLQVVQSVDGGVVEKVFVKEGQRVEQGQLLVRIDPTRFVANLREGSARAFALGAKVERLNALVNGTVYDPQQPEALDGQGSEAALILAQERQYYFESKRQLQERLLMAQQQLAQRREELREVHAALRTAERSYQQIR